MFFKFTELEFLVSETCKPIELGLYLPKSYLVRIPYLNIIEAT